MRLLFARHGETDWNIAKRVQGTTDVPLNENGIRQAEILCRNLQKMNVKLFRIYSSYQSRALATARIVGKGFDVPVKVVPGLEEMNLGKFGGHTWREIETLYSQELKEWQSDKRYHMAPNGESYQMVLERLFAALDRIMDEGKEEQALDKDVLIVSHGAVIMTLLALKDDIPFEQAYTIDVENARAIEIELSQLQEIRRKL